MCAALAALLATASTVRAEISLPSVVGDNMVLQRGVATIWGWDAPDQKVKVTFRGQSVEARIVERVDLANAGRDGRSRWEAQIPTGLAGGPFELQIEGSTSVTIKNVLVGEVWVAGGQSNMWWLVAASKGWPDTMKEATDDGLRVYDGNVGPMEAGQRAGSPRRSIESSWAVDSPQTVGAFPATAYFFARELRKTLKVPVGIVHVAVPGTEIELHLPPSYLQNSFPLAQERHKKAIADFPAQLEAYETARRDWKKARDAAKAEGKPEPEKPKEVVDPNSKAGPGELWNGTVAPVAPFECRGFIWYQGEGNSARPEEYRTLFPGLIANWRRVWGGQDKPFLWVELANFGNRQNVPMQDDGWSAIRDAQKSGFSLPNTFEVSAIDNLDPEGPVWNIHPLDKQLVGHRLALAARANVYDEELIWSGPRFQSATFKGNKATIQFRFAQGLKAKPAEGELAALGIDDGSLRGFALAGADRKWSFAKAEIVGGAVVLSSPEVPHPVAARYAWHINPNGNLINSAGLPAFPFRTDSWPLVVK